MVGCAARVRARSSAVKGPLRGSLTRRACGAALDCGASTGPGQRDRGQAGACPRRCAALSVGPVLVDLVEVEHAGVEQLAVDWLGLIVGGGGSGL